MGDGNVTSPDTQNRYAWLWQTLGISPPPSEFYFFWQLWWQGQPISDSNYEICIFWTGLCKIASIKPSSSTSTSMVISPSLIHSFHDFFRSFPWSKSTIFRAFHGDFHGDFQISPQISPAVSPHRHLLHRHFGCHQHHHVAPAARPGDLLCGRPRGRPWR